MSGVDVVAIARGWIGTPYVHQASAKGAGTDCLGLLRGVWRELFLAEPAVVPPYSADWSEPQRDETLWRAAQQHLEREVIGWPGCWRRAAFPDAGWSGRKAFGNCRRNRQGADFHTCIFGTCRRRESVVGSVAAKDSVLL